MDQQQSNCENEPTVKEPTDFSQQTVNSEEDGVISKVFGFVFSLIAIPIFLVGLYFSIVKFKTTEVKLDHSNQTVVIETKTFWGYRKDEESYKFDKDKNEWGTVTTLGAFKTLDDRKISTLKL